MASWVTDLKAERRVAFVSGSTYAPTSDLRSAPIIHEVMTVREPAVSADLWFLALRKKKVDKMCNGKKRRKKNLLNKMVELLH